jgi:hypothetical protein
MTIETIKQDQAISEMQQRLETLEARKVRLEAESRQRAERAKDLESEIHASEARMRRQRDTHEKAHLGSIMKMVRLDRFRLSDEQPTDNQTASFDVDLLVGALLTLSEQLENVERATPARLEELRRKGAAFRALKPLQRKVPGKQRVNTA